MNLKTYIVPFLAVEIIVSAVDRYSCSTSSTSATTDRRIHCESLWLKVNWHRRNRRCFRLLLSRGRHELLRSWIRDNTGFTLVGAFGAAGAELAVLVADCVRVKT